MCPLENDDGGELGNGDQEANVGIFPKGARGGGVCQMLCYGAMVSYYTGERPMCANCY